MLEGDGDALGAPLQAPGQGGGAAGDVGGSPSLSAPAVILGAGLRRWQGRRGGLARGLSFVPSGIRLQVPGAPLFFLVLTLGFGFGFVLRRLFSTSAALSF